jgi:hypothetical protein
MQASYPCYIQDCFNPKCRPLDSDLGMSANHDNTSYCMEELSHVVKGNRARGYSIQNSPQRASETLYLVFKENNLPPTPLIILPMSSHLYVLTLSSVVHTQACSTIDFLVKIFESPPVLPFPILPIPPGLPLPLTIHHPCQSMSKTFLCPPTLG